MLTGSGASGLACPTKLCPPRNELAGWCRIARTHVVVDTPLAWAASLTYPAFLNPEPPIQNPLDGFRVLWLAWAASQPAGGVVAAQVAAWMSCLVLSRRFSHAWHGEGEVISVWPTRFEKNDDAKLR